MPCQAGIDLEIAASFPSYKYNSAIDYYAEEKGLLQIEFI
jgi:hypothetical protein